MRTSEGSVSAILRLPRTTPLHIIRWLTIAPSIPDTLSFAIWSRSYCSFCSATPCSSPCTSTSSPNWSCSACLCPTTPATCDQTVTCPFVCSTGIYQTTTVSFSGVGRCPICSCSRTPPPASCTPLTSCWGSCAPGPATPIPPQTKCGSSGGLASTHLPNDPCPSCQCRHMLVCTPPICPAVACSTGTMGLTKTDPCAYCESCVCRPHTCPKVEGCTGTCEGGGTLGVATYGCSHSCSEYCACMTDSREGTIARIREIGGQGEEARSKQSLEVRLTEVWSGAVPTQTPGSETGRASTHIVASEGQEVPRAVATTIGM